MCRPLLCYCLENKFVSKDDIKLSFWPTTTLPADLFVEPCRRLDAAIAKEAQYDVGGNVERIGKQLFNKAIGFMVSIDESMRFIYRCSTDAADRPPNSVQLPKIETPLHEWVQCVEQRSYDSLRPIEFTHKLCRSADFECTCWPGTSVRRLSAFDHNTWSRLGLMRGISIVLKTCTRN